MFKQVRQNEIQVERNSWVIKNDIIKYIQLSLKKAAGYEQNQVNCSAKGQTTQATLGVKQIRQCSAVFKFTGPDEIHSRILKNCVKQSQNRWWDACRMENILEEGNRE